MQNKNLEELINNINHISLNHEDLMDELLNFSKIYLSNKKNEEKTIDLFFANSNFIETAIMATREGIVIGMSSLTLAQDIDFESICSGCINIQIEDETLLKLNLNSVEEIMYKSFLKELRVQMFTEVYLKNKDLFKISKIPKEVLNKRYEYFINR